MEPDDLLCSRNARPQKALVGRAQWKIIQPPSLRDNEQAWNNQLDGWCSSDARSEGQSGNSLGRENMMAQKRKQEALAQTDGKFVEVLP